MFANGRTRSAAAPETVHPRHDDRATRPVFRHVAGATFPDGIRPRIIAWIHIIRLAAGINRNTAERPGVTRRGNASWGANLGRGVLRNNGRRRQHQPSDTCQPSDRRQSSHHPTFIEAIAAARSPIVGSTSTGRVEGRAIWPGEPALLRGPCGVLPKHPRSPKWRSWRMSCSSVCPDRFGHCARG